MTITVIRYAVTVTIPAATIQVPTVTALLPAMRLIDVTVSLAHPPPTDPHVPVAVPVPIAWHPNVTSTCCRHNLCPMRWWCDSNGQFYGS